MIDFSSLQAQVAAALARYAANIVQVDEPIELDPYVLIGQLFLELTEEEIEYVCAGI